MGERAANSSDLARARALSGQLSGQQEGRQTLTGGAPEHFARFSSDAAVPKTSRLDFDPTYNIPRDFESWDDLLAWTRDLIQCEVSFVVDPEGFVIAQNGDRSLEELEGIGAQFQDVANQATEIDVGAARALALQIDTFWLSGLRFSQEGTGHFLLGIIADEPLSKEVQKAISVQVEHNLTRM